MSTNPPAPPTLTCKECSYANEPERVYCHNCGAKLDRSVLPKEETLRRESPDKARKRIMRMANPPSAVLRRELSAFFKTMIFALLAAMIIEALRPPDDVPNARSEVMARLIGSDLNTLVQSPVPRSVSFTEADLNAFLRTGKVKDQGAIPGVEFKRAYVNLLPGAALVVAEKSVWGYLMYVGSIYRVEGSSGVLTFTNTGGNVGRLPIHPLIMSRVSPFMIGPLAEALKREGALLQQMQSVTIVKGRVDLVSAGKK